MRFMGVAFVGMVMLFAFDLLSADLAGFTPRHAAPTQSKPVQKGQDVISRMKAMKLDRFRVMSPTMLFTVIDMLKNRVREEACLSASGSNGFNVIVRLNASCPYDIKQDVVFEKTSFYDILQKVCKSVNYDFYVRRHVVYVCSADMRKHDTEDWLLKWEKSFVRRATANERALLKKLKTIRVPSISMTCKKCTTTDDALLEIKRWLNDPSVEIVKGDGIRVPMVPRLELSDLSLYDAMYHILSSIDCRFIIKSNKIIIDSKDNLP